MRWQGAGSGESTAACAKENQSMWGWELGTGMSLGREISFYHACTSHGICQPGGHWSYDLN